MQHDIFLGRIHLILNFIANIIEGMVNITGYEKKNENESFKFTPLLPIPILFPLPLPPPLLLSLFLPLPLPFLFLLKVVPVQVVGYLSAKVSREE